MLGLFIIRIEPTTQLFGQCGHTSLLGADISRYIYRQTVRNSDRFASEQCCTKCAGKRISCTYRIGYLDFGSIVIGAFVGGKHITAAGSAGENHHLQSVIFDLRGGASSSRSRRRKNTPTKRPVPRSSWRYPGRRLRPFCTFTFTFTFAYAYAYA